MSERWTEHDDRRLLFHLGSMPLARLAKTLNRTPRAIEQRCRRHGRRIRLAIVNEYGMSTRAAADALGTDRQRVEKWIKLGWLHARRHPFRTRCVLTVDHEALETFLRTIGGLLHGLAPDAEWADIAADAQRELRIRYINRHELSGIFCLAPQTFGSVRWRTHYGFPAPVLCLDYLQCWHERAAVREWLRTAHPRYRTPRVLRAFGVEV